MSESSFQGVGGLKIFTRSWRPSVGKPRSVVVIAHGFNSHSGYYQWVAEQFVNHGVEKFTVRSTRPRSRVAASAFTTCRIDR